MALPKLQNPLDWTTQLWNITFGKRVDAHADALLLGPMGDIGGIADKFVQRLADEQGLMVQRNKPNVGLVDDLSSLLGGVNPKISDFYHHTLHYDLDAWTQWKPIFGSLGYVVYRLFTKRIQQLNLPQNSMDTAYGLKSEIISLVDANGRVVYRVWYRRLNKTNEVVYSGVYTHCQIPSGETCLKVIFPLPQGSATVVMRMSANDDGNFELVSQGKRYGDPGFYFLVEDRKGGMWKHYLPSFHERIFVYEGDERTLRADHSMTLWRSRVYDLHYKMTKKPL